MRAWRCLELCDDPRAARIGDVDHRRPDATFTHVTDKGEPVLQVDVHAIAMTVQTGLADQAHVQGFGLSEHGATVAFPMWRTQSVVQRASTARITPRWRRKSVPVGRDG